MANLKIIFDFLINVDIVIRYWRRCLFVDLLEIKGLTMIEEYLV